MINVNAEENNSTKFDIKLKNNSDEVMTVKIISDNPNYSGVRELASFDATTGKRLPLECEKTDTCKDKITLLVVGPKDHYEKELALNTPATFKLHVGEKEQFGGSMERKLVRKAGDVAYNITYDKAQKKGNFEITVLGKEKDL